MSEAKFVKYDLKLVEPAFDSSLTDLIIELDYLRKKALGGSTHPRVFFQLKDIFHILESIGSARIEGNNTTIAEYIETKLEDTQHSSVSSNIREIQNIEKVMRFVEEMVGDYPINKLFLSELHKMIVADLQPPPDGEGDNTPGVYRTENLKINQSDHLPPDFLQVDDFMEELFNFISKRDSPKYDLLKTAIAHHRFVWIHPYGNGNGRTVRLFTYAMLMKLGFNVERILNPTAIFCTNRNIYYEKLAKADTGTDSGILEWCEYVLKGLKEEIEKIDKLSDYNYLKKEILLPTLDYSLKRKYITEIEAKILRRVVELQIIQASDLKDIFKGKASAEISRQIKRLIDKKMLIPESVNGRKYLIRFDNNFLLRGVIQTLDAKGFLPIHD